MDLQQEKRLGQGGLDKLLCSYPVASHLTELELEPSPLNDLIILRPNHHIVCSAFRVSTVISAIQTSYLSLMLLLIDRSKVLGTILMVLELP